MSALSNVPALSRLADDINELHGLAQMRAAEAVAYAARCGAKLTEAKAACQHGQWLGWLADNCHVGARQAQNYI